MREENTMELTIKKSDINAQNPYQYNKLEAARFYFVPCTVKETHDELELIFDLSGMRPFSIARKMRDADKYGFLVQILEAVMDNPDYIFSLDPENLYLDEQGRVRVLERDVSTRDIAEASGKILDIQALAGYMFQKKYMFSNYKEGGLKLLKEQKRTKFLSEIESLEQAVVIFKERQEIEQAQDAEDRIHVNRHVYKRNLIIMAAAIAGCFLMTAYSVYQYNWVMKPQKSALLAERAYMEHNYTGVADALADIPVEQLDKHEKYLLATVYIQGQSVDSFDMDTKKRLLSKLSYNGDENLLDYWICLGRLDTDGALDIAMRMSDNQLILYAYLQKIDIVSADQTLTGAEKTEQIEELKGNIKSLADKLGIDYKETQTEGE